MKTPKKSNRDYLTVTVPFAATRAVEPPLKQQWAHPLVWTESMLKTLLERKVRGGGNGSQKGSQRGSQKESFGSQKGSHLGQVNLVFNVLLN